MVDKRPIGEIAGKSNYLDKKVPKNPKYTGVTSKLETGFHANHVEVISDQNIAKRKGELFQRIKPSTLAALLKRETNSESIYNLAGSPEAQHNDYDIAPSDSQSVYSAYTAKTGYSEASKMSSITSATAQLLLADNSEFLLLDLREPDDYDLYHIKESMNYPAPNLGRDKVLPELFKFKNKEGKLIIIYHLDERNGVPLANLMAQKGYENVYLLTGGIEAFVEAAHQYLEGKKVPAPLKQEKKVKVIYKTSKHLGSPEEGNVVIPSKHIEDDQKSVISNITRTSNMTGASKPVPKSTTQSTFNKTALSAVSKIKK